MPLRLGQFAGAWLRSGQVAHATLINQEGKTIALEPYLNVTQPRPAIKIEEVQQWTADFQALAGTIQWFSRWKIEPHSRSDELFPEQEPDLILHLRTQDAQKRRDKKVKHPSSAE